MTSNKQFEELMESVNSGVVVLQDEKIVYINDYAARGVGLPKSDIIGKHFLEFVPPEDRELTQKRFADLLSSKESVKGFEARLLDGNGNLRIAVINSAPTNFNNVPAKIISIRDLTGEKELIAEKTKSEEKFKNLYQNCADAIFIADIITNKIIDCNQQAEILLSCSRDSIIGMRAKDLHPEDVVERTMKDFERHSAGVQKVVESDVITKAGHRIPVSINSHIIELDGKKCLMGVFRDISELKENENELRRRENHFKLLFNSLPYGGEVISKDGIILECSHSTALMLEYEQSELIGEHITKFITKDSLPMFKKLFPKLIAGEPKSAEIKMITKNGKELNILRAAQPLFDEHGKVTSVLAINTDITKQKEVTLQLEEKERQLQSIYHDPNIFIGVLDKDGKVINANKPALDFIDKKIEDVSGIEFWETPWWTHSKEQQELLKSSYKNALKGKPANFDAKHVSPEGNLVIVNFSIRPIKNNEGEISNFLVEGINITEQVSAEEGLKESEKRYRALSENAPVGVWHADLNGNVTYINPKLSEISGLTPDEATGGKWGTKVHPEDKDRVSNEWEKYITEDKPYTSIYRFVHDDGDIKWVLENGTTIFDEKNIKVAHIGTITDITDRILSEQKFEESEKKFRSTIEDIHLFAIMLDDKANIIFANKFLLEKTGWKNKDVLGKNYFDVFVSKEVRPRSKKRFKEIINSKKLFTKRINEVITKDGKQLIVEWNVTAQYDDENKLMAATSIGNDITEKLKIESDLRFQSQLIKQSYESMLTTDLDFKISWVNRSFTKLFGYSQDEVLGKTPDFLNAEPLADEIQQSIYQSMKAGKLIRTKLLNKKKDGSTFVCELSVYPVKDNEGNVIAYSGHQYDVTDEVNSRKELEESAERLRLSTESGNIGIWDWNLVDNILIWDERMYELYGISPKQFEGAYEAWEKTVHPEDIEEANSEVQAAIKGEKDFRTQFRVIWPSGEIRYIKANAIVIKNENDEPVRMIGVNWDITQEKLSEAKIIENTKKLESIFRSSPMGIHVYNLNDKDELIFNSANNAAAKILGVDHSQFIGKTIEEAFPSLKKTEIPKRYKDVAMSGNEWHTEDINYNEQGIIGAYDVTAFQSLPGTVIVQFMDITDQKKAEVSIIESEKKYRELFENQIEAYAYHEIILNKKGEPIDFKFLDVNDTFLKELNIKKKSDVVGKSIREVDPKIDKKWIKIYGEIALTGEAKRFEDKFLSNNKWYNIFAYSPRKGMFATSFIDITEEKEAEEKVHQSEERFRSTFESVGEGIILVGRDGNVLYANDSLLKMTNLDGKDLIGKHVLGLAKKLVDAKQLPGIVKNITKALSLKMFQPFEVDYNNKTIRIGIAFNKLNKSIIGIIQDVTEEKKAELELKEHREHLEELVEKRTVDLRRKNEELDNALKVFVGRELTIKNLRNEISKLEKELKLLRN